MHLVIGIVLTWLCMIAKWLRKLLRLFWKQGRSRWLCILGMLTEKVLKFDKNDRSLICSLAAIKCNKVKIVVTFIFDYAFD